MQRRAGHRTSPGGSNPGDDFAGPQQSVIGCGTEQQVARIVLENHYVYICMVGEIIAFGGVSILLLAVLSILVYWFYYVPVYNSFVELKEDVEKAQSDIEVLLQRRQDELNRLSIAVREATGHEATTLNEIISAREGVDAAGVPMEQADADRHVRNVLADVDARTEQYPEIAAIGNIDKLQENIVTIEQKLAEQRETYNNVVTRYNKRVQAIPQSFIASVGGFEKREQFEASKQLLSGEGIGLEPPAEGDTALGASGDHDRALAESTERDRALDAASEEEATDGDVE